jgi:glycosyltransferase involved in cell wall biosynthesis
VVTIYDVNYVGHGGMMSAGRRKLLASMVPRVAHSAAWITTTSEFSRSEIVRHMGVPAEKIVVTHAGGPRAGMPPEPTRTSENFAISDPYVVAVSGTLPHKNIAKLVEAFSLIAGQIPHRLVLIGRPTAGTDFQQQAAQLGIGDRLLMTGYVPDECMAPLLGGADLFVFPSLYEGFGLPLLEAQAAGVPVICSNAGSLPEVAGDGAEFFDPTSAEAIAAMIVRLVRDPVLRTHLAVRGAANLQRFSWEKTAGITLDVYHRVAQRKSATL